MKFGKLERNRVGWAIRLAPGGLIFALALAAPNLRRPHGWLLPLGWTLAVCGLAVCVLALALGTRWQRCSGLFALALVGQAVALQLVDSPPYSVYQRYFSWNQDLLSWERVLTSLHGLFLLGLLGQTVIVAWAARPLWPEVKDAVSRLTTLRQRVVLALLFVFAGVLFSRSVLLYGVELLLTGWIAVVGALNLILTAAAIPSQALKGRFESLRRLYGRESDLAERTPFGQVLPWVIAGWVTVVAAVIALFVFERVPHIPDDVSYLFQAKYLSTGRLYLPAPPDNASFAVSHVVNDGAKWFGYGMPGWPVILALGVIAGAPWLVNPLLGGLTVLLVHALTRGLYGRSMAIAAVSLLALSPWFLFMSASFMGHTVAVVWTLAALLAVEKERKSGSGLWGTLAGCFIGALFLTRPLEGISVGAAIGLWALGLGGSRLRRRAVVGLVAASLCVGALALAYNRVLTGDALYTPHMKWTDEAWYRGADRLGFGSTIGNVGWPHIDPLPGHGPGDVLINANKNLYMTNFELFGWSFGSLAFAALAVSLGGRRREDTIFAAIVVATVFGHSFYWFSGGPDIGARYWYQMLVPLLVLTLRGVQTVQRWLFSSVTTKSSPWRLSAFVAVASLVAFVNVMPWRSLDKYHHYRGMSADVKRLADSNGFGHSLVFVRAEDQEDYASAFVLNPPTLTEAGTVYALDRGPDQRQTLRRHFPDRQTWIVGRDASSGSRMQVLAGPLAPHEPADQGPKVSSAYPQGESGGLVNRQSR